MIVDLRSDTVTKPTQEMYEAMRNAELGDDVLGDDPTVIALEELAAQKVGKESAMFVPSGTMGNQIAVRTWVNPGDGIILEQDCHLLFNESGGPGALSGAVTWTLPSKNGVMDPEMVKARINAGSIHTPATKLLCLENTHNRAGGTVITIENMRQFRKVTDDAGMKVHLDGARIFNAAACLGAKASEIAAQADSVMFCLSKGLSCPIGSLLSGPYDFIAEARYHRKRMGGGMRQAGILAACGIYALDNLTERLVEDHRRARDFAETINSCPGFSVDMETVQTNIVRVVTQLSASDWQIKFAERGIKVFATGPHSMRFVFHREIDDEKLEYAKKVVSELPQMAESLPG